MRLKAFASTIVPVLLCVALATSAAAQAGTEKRTAGGSKSMTGCLIKLDSGFGLKTDDGTYQLNTDRDLSNFVGKQVKIDGTWKASGTFTTAPVGGATGGENATAPAPSGAPSAGTPAFVGELNLQITGTVVGNCAAEPK
jgi:hypothetical protein